MRTHTLSLGRTCTMSCDQRHPFPPAFPGDGSPQYSAQPPNLVPCWSFPAAQERVRGQGKSRGSSGVSPSLALIVLLLFLLVFAALGFEAYQINNMQTELREMRQGKPVTDFYSTAKQIGLPEPQLQEKDEDNRPAAHVIGRIEKELFPKTLRWEPKVGRAFFSGGVAYRVEDGGLQVNESGLYHIYSRVELIFKKCPSTSWFVHSVFVRRTERSPPQTLMEAHRDGFCAQLPGQPRTSESYLGSALMLQKYDRVFVNVSHPANLSHEHYANFFGLYKI